ncbi:MAG: hypothetical protein JO242_26160, partial [Streptosporangiaceae bacterium]|nr:hypothetical protein [Streptosporangiaceae bacterium]
MRELREFRLPDVGEGLTEADIVSWHVKPGDAVEVNQVIVEIETAKAIVELPSPYDGVVARLLAEEGQTVDVGTPIIAVDVGGTAPDAAGAAPAEPAGATSQDQIPERAPAPPQAQPASPSGEPAEPAGEPQQRQPVLVGYGVKPGSTTRRPRKAPAASGAAASA